MRKKYKIHKGGRQLKVTIPREWARHHGLDGGDEVWIEFSDTPVLKIYPTDVVRKPDVRMPD